MGLIEILEGILVVVTVLFFLAFFSAICGWLAPGADYMPMSPDEEYRWLTEDMGLTHDEAEDIMRSPEWED
jgi:hypothetical protein